MKKVEYHKIKKKNEEELKEFMTELNSFDINIKFTYVTEEFLF